MSRIGEPPLKPNAYFGIRSFALRIIPSCDIVASLMLLSPHLHLASKSSSPAAVTLIGDGELDALTLGQRDPWLLLSDDAEVG